MARKAPAVPIQVTEPMLASNAFLKGRLIDFDTGSDQLEMQHQNWLRDKMSVAKTNSMYRVRLVGYASKVGDETKNSTLSYNRINRVQKFLESLDDDAKERVETFRAVGEAAYQAPESDNSPTWRAVEVHIFIGDIPPPPPPPYIRPIVKPPLPGGERYTEWAITSPGGVFFAAGVGIGFNVFLIKNTQLNDERGYIQPVIGGGVSVAIPKLKLVWNLVQQTITGFQYSAPDYTPVTTRLPLTWEEMGNCLVNVGSISAGAVVGYAAAHVTFTAAKVWQYSPQGNPVNISGKEQFRVICQGRDWQIGAGASYALGPLHRVGN